MILLDDEKNGGNSKLQPLLKEKKVIGKDFLSSMNSTDQ